MYNRFIPLVIMLMIALPYAQAQCNYTSNVSSICPNFTYPLSGFSSTCNGVTNCDGLTNGYLVVSVPDTLVLDVLEESSFLASDYTGGITIVPFCYNLDEIQNFVDIVINQSSCCFILNTQVPGFCDSITNNFDNGSEVQNLNDLIVVLESFSMGDMTPNLILNILNSLNDNIGALEFFCQGITPFSYCFDSVDFSAENTTIYDINPDVCPFADCTDSIEIKPVFLSTYPHQPIFRAIDLISAEGDMLTDHEFRSENEVVLLPNFTTIEGAELEIIIEDCVTNALGLHPNK